MTAPNMMGGLASLPTPSITTQTTFAGPPAQAPAAQSGAGVRPPAGEIMAALKQSIDNGEPESDRVAYLQSFGMTKDQWLAVANAYRGSKDNSLSQLPPNVDVTTGAPMQWRVALASTPNPADKLVMLQRLLQQHGLDPRSAQPFGTNNFAYNGPNGPMLFDEVTRDPVLGVLPVPTLRDVVESVPTAGRAIGMMGGAAVAAPAGTALGGPVGGLAAGAGGAGVGSELVGGPIEALYRQLGGVQGPGAQADVRNAINGMSDAAMTQATFGGLGMLGGKLADALGVVKFDPANPGMSTKDILAASGKARVPMTLGEILQNRALSTIENSLRQIPTSANVMARLDAQTFDAMRREAGDMASGFAGGRVPQSATAFNDGLRNASADYLARFQATRAGIDDALAKAFAANPKTAAGVPITNVQQAYVTMEQAAQKSATQAEVLAPVLKEASRLIQTAQQTAALNGGNPIVPIQDLLTERSNFADESGFGMPTGTWKTKTTQAFQELWSAARQDIQDGATLAGPDAAELQRMHDTYVQMAHDNKAFANYDNFKTWAQLSQGKTPTQWALDMSRTPDMIRQIRGNVRPSQWDDIVGAVAQDMGRASSGAQTGAGDVWSPDMFKTNLDKMRGIKQALFGETPYQDAFEKMQNMGKLADDLSGALKTFNRSQTGASFAGRQAVDALGQAGIGVLVGMGTHNPLEGIGAGATSLIAPWAAAKLLTNPNANRVIGTFVSGLTDAAKAVGADGAMKFAASNGPRLVARMYALQKLDQNMKDPIDQYLSALKDAGFPGADPATYQRLSTPQATFAPRP